MTAVARYVGRHGGSGVDDSPSGPEIVAALFADGAGVQIDDPLSFPWHLVEVEDWRQPITVDLRGCTSDDLAALAEVLPVLTPDDRAIVASAVRPYLTDRLALPESAYLDATEDDPQAALDARRSPKLRRALLREVLEPIVGRELGSAGAGDDSRPLLVIEWGAEDSWHESFVPAPHRYACSSAHDPPVPGSAAIAILGPDQLDPATLDAALVALQPSGLVILVLGEEVVATATSPSTSDVIAMIDAATGRRQVFEHVWGLHPEPGARTVGGIIAVRPLGGPP